MENFRDEASKLSKVIKIYRRKEHFNPFDHSKEVSAENDWGASFFYASIQLHTILQPYHTITKEKVYEIYTTFQRETGLKVDVDGLFKRNWLRIVNQKLNISGVIRYSVFDIDKVANLKGEFGFLSELMVAHVDGKISVAAFEQAIVAFNKTHTIVLDVAVMKKNNWIQEKDEVITIQNLDYYRPLVEYANDFLFIKKLRDCLADETQNRLVISIHQLTNLHTSHTALFPATPSVKDLIEKKVLTSNGHNYILNFRCQDSPFSGMILDKAGAKLWNSLLAEEQFSNDLERIRYWHDRMVHHHHWCSIRTYFNLDAKKRFLDAALQVVLTEEDLTSGEEEYLKIKLDQAHRVSTISYVLSEHKNEPEFPTDSDLFDLYEGIEAIDNRWQHQLMWPQDAREDIFYYINQIVRNDEENSCERILCLLEAGSAKPYALWKTCWNLYYWEPHIIPNLLYRSKTAALGFTLLWKLKKGENVLADKPIVFEEIATSCFGLLCRFLATNAGLDNQEKAKVIFQCLYISFHDKMKVISPDAQKNMRHKINATQLGNSLCDVFEHAVLPGRVITINGPIEDLWYPVVLKELYKQVADYKPFDYFRNNSLAIPHVELDFLLWIMKLAKNLSDKKMSRELQSIIIQKFVSFYLDSINTGKKAVWDYFKKTTSENVPIWHNQQSNNGLLDWKSIFIAMEQDNILDEFLSPTNLQMEVAQNKYEEYNRFVANKIRTHLSILLNGYHTIFKDQIILSAQGYPITPTLTKLENKVTSLVIKYCINKPENKQIDIFDSLFERTFWSTEKEELLPQIGNALNRFSKDNKNRILKELVSSDQIVRCFKLLEFVVSESDKAILLSILNNQDIQNFFSETYTRTDAEYVLQQLAENKVFAEKAKQALTIWEKVKIKNSHALNDQHEINCFRIKLLLAYHDQDEEKVDQIPDPKLRSHYQATEFSASRSRTFYKALVYLTKNRAPEAYSIFDTQLKTEGRDKVSLALNRFAAKIRWADNTSNVDDKKRLYREAIDEWKQYENTLLQQNELDFVKEMIWLNKLYVYSALTDYQAFDELFNKLEKPLQLSKDFLELSVMSLIKRKMQVQAESILSEAEEYHRLSNGNAPEFILRLKTHADNDDIIKVLREQYLRIFSRSAESLIKILPHKFTKDFGLPEFILSELVSVAEDVLTYVNSVSSIKKEDKYSDLLVLALSNRFKNYTWHVGNARGGFPESGKLNPGEIDFAIFGPGERITICEALILKGKNVANVEKHNFKVFNYDATRKFFFIIIYYLGDENKFKENWNGYKTDLASVIEFPSGFELDGMVEDLSSTFGNDSIKTGKSLHGATTTLFHIFININYHKRKTREKERTDN
ncbi:hypothetical protein OCK74_15000 [Chitinophagaceae bacterium LB-8]|uniref:Uncharacterized protein n=1 Tax=Paraflavisolibacter caeni TaxID=2982496 RepID=A0A9X2XXL6_9BACT|nr:hypothetical protein [Paraflavisolibacter caeni]MCU7550427.1 hypothetical protein [Paraflavisolibacter caeni]